MNRPIERRKVRMTITVMSTYDGGTREAVIKMLDDALAQVPEEARPSARFELTSEQESYSDSEYPRLYLYYDRDETPEEFNKRIEAEQRGRENRRRAYEELKKEFGDDRAQATQADQDRSAKGEDPQGNPSGWTHPLARH